MTCRQINIDQAKKELCSSIPYTTREIQSITLNVPVQKSKVSFKLSDTCGLTDEINSDCAIRSGMAQSLSLLRCADLILHVIDAVTCLSPENKQAISRIDLELYHYGITSRKYIVLVNKMDLPAAYGRISSLKEAFPQAQIIPISALYQQGFQEVKACVARNV